MGKARDLFKKIGEIKGTFYARMGTTKDRNGMGLTEAEETKKKWQEYIELYKKIYSCQSRRIGGKRQEVWGQYIHTAIFTMDKQQEPTG